MLITDQFSSRARVLFLIPIHHLTCFKLHIELHFFHANAKTALSVFESPGHHASAWSYAGVVVVRPRPLIILGANGAGKAVVAALLAIARRPPFEAELQVLEPHWGVAGCPNHPRVLATAPTPIRVIQITTR